MNNKNKWLRLFARLTDYTLLSGILSFLTGLLPIYFTDMHYLVLYALTPLLFVPIESALIALLGSTPGKALLGIKVLGDDGKRLSFKASLKRALSVWIYGTGCGIMPASLVTCVLFFRKKQTKWAGQVTFPKKGALRLVLSLFVFMCALTAGSDSHKALLDAHTNLFSATETNASDLVNKSWKTYESPDKRFKARFPSAVEQNTIEIRISAKDSLFYEEHKSEHKESGAFSVCHTTLPKDALKWGSKLVLKHSLKAISDYLPKTRILKQKDKQFLDYPSLDYILSSNGEEIKGTLVLVDNTLYKIEASYKPHLKEELQDLLYAFKHSFEPLSKPVTHVATTNEKGVKQSVDKG